MANKTSSPKSQKRSPTFEETIGAKELTFGEKLRLLVDRYRRHDFDLYQLIGVSPVTYSKWSNGHVRDIRPEFRAKLLDLSYGLLVAKDFEHEAPPKAAAPKPAPQPALDDDLGLDL